MKRALVLFIRSLPPTAGPYYGVAFARKIFVTRDGFLARLLADRYRDVTALDLIEPEIADERIACVAGDVTQLTFPDASFDLVVCAEVLEHIKPALLQTACSELVRVTRRHLLIGVPYKQDTRVGRTTCPTCGTRNPAWGHVSRFDEASLRDFFPGLPVVRSCLVGVNDEATNFVSSSLMDLAGNPFGTYGQDEACVNCGGRLDAPPPRQLHQKVLTKIGFWAAYATKPFKPRHANWIHLLLSKGEQP